MRRHQEQKPAGDGPPPPGPATTTPGPQAGPAPRNIDTAQLQVMRSVPYVQKGSKTKSSRGDRQADYSFASEGEIIAALRPAMVEAGIVVRPVRVRVVRQHTYTARSGSVLHSVRLRVRYRFTHAPSGTFALAETVGEAADSGDKAASKAMTIAFKYALREFFCIETGDDPDKVHPDALEADPEQSGGERGSFERCRAALASAPDRAYLDRYLDIARRGRNYSPAQWELLNATYQERLDALGRQPQTTNGGPAAPRTPITERR